MIRRFLAVLAVLCLTASASDYDRYGGWRKLKGGKTGFFHTQKVKDRWWLVTPDGSAFFSKGVCHAGIDPESESSPPAPADCAAWQSSSTSSRTTPTRPTFPWNE
ncbi:MAG: hypothetical protein HY822_09820 [Acidobacteria bacterium]|nr:hypothetical protein [Acidobacteriota bacterium]